MKNSKECSLYNDILYLDFEMFIYLYFGFET